MGGRRKGEGEWGGAFFVNWERGRIEIWREGCREQGGEDGRWGGRVERGG